MATLGTALIGKISGDSPAEKAFKPWWDNMQNFLVYGLVMLGKLLDFFKIPIMTNSLRILKVDSVFTSFQGHYRHQTKIYTTAKAMFWHIFKALDVGTK